MGSCREYLFGIMAFWALRGWPARGIYFVASVVATTIIIFASQFFKEISFILADIADSITDSNSIHLES
jgi:hypothetical protein